MANKVAQIILSFLLAVSASHVYAQTNTQKLDELFNKIASDQKMLFNGIVIVAEMEK